MGKLSEFEGSKDLNNQELNNDILTQYNNLKDLPKEELNSRLFDEVAKQKKEGTFDFEKLENMVESLKSGLSDEDYNNVKRMLNLLK